MGDAAYLPNFPYLSKAQFRRCDICGEWIYHSDEWQLMDGGYRHAWCKEYEEAI